MIPMSILDFHLILNMSSVYVPLLGFQKSAMWQMQLTVDSTATIPPVHSLMKQPLCQTPGTECKALWAPVTHDAVTRSSNSKSGDPPPRDPIAVQRCNGATNPDSPITAHQNNTGSMAGQPCGSCGCELSMLQGLAMKLSSALLSMSVSSSLSLEACQDSDPSSTRSFNAKV